MVISLTFFSFEIFSFASLISHGCVGSCSSCSHSTSGTISLSRLRTILYQPLTEECATSSTNFPIHTPLRTVAYYVGGAGGGGGGGGGGGWGGVGRVSVESDVSYC